MKLEWWENPAYAEARSKIESEVMEETLAQDPVAQLCQYRRFVSRIAYGKLRPQAVIVELVGYNGRWHQINSKTRNPLDKIATEVLGNSVDPDQAERILLTRLRALPQQREIIKNRL